MNSHPAPRPGAIYWAFAPEEEGFQKGKLRPVFVAGSELRSGIVYAEFYKITTQRIDEWFSGEVPLRERHLWASCGLSKPSKIILTRCPRYLAFNLDWFGSLTPIGHLNEEVLARIRVAAKEIGLFD